MIFLPTLVQSQYTRTVFDCFDNVPDIIWYSPKHLWKCRTNSSRCKPCQEQQLPTKAKYNTSLDFVKLPSICTPTTCPSCPFHLDLSSHPSPLPFPINNHVTVRWESSSIIRHSSPNYAPPTNMLLSGI